MDGRRIAPDALHVTSSRIGATVARAAEPFPVVLMTVESDSGRPAGLDHLPSLAKPLRFKKLAMFIEVLEPLIELRLYALQSTA